MAQALDPIDTLLAELRRDIGNTLCVIDVVVALRRNRPQLLPLLRGMLGELSQHIEASLSTIPAELTTQQAADLLLVAGAGRGAPGAGGAHLGLTGKHRARRDRCRRREGQERIGAARGSSGKPAQTFQPQGQRGDH